MQQAFHTYLVQREMDQLEEQRKRELGSPKYLQRMAAWEAAEIHPSVWSNVAGVISNIRQPGPTVIEKLSWTARRSKTVH